MILLDGRRLSKKILSGIKKRIKNRHLKLKLAVVLIGENPVSEVFINQKRKSCEKIGISFELFRFPSRIAEQALKSELVKIVRNPKNSGIIVQLPLPERINTQEVLNLIPPEKDIDVLSENSLGRFYTGRLPAYSPVVAGISHLLKEYKITLKGKNVVVIGAGRLVGKPLTLWLLQEKAIVSLINEFAKDISFFTKKADIVISGVGKPNLIKGNMIKKGAVVVDAGTIVEKGRLTGDIEFKSVAKKASYITPVPGGVGPMTVACLLENLVKLHR